MEAALCLQLTQQHLWPCPYQCPPKECSGEPRLGLLAQDYGGVFIHEAKLTHLFYMMHKDHKVGSCYDSWVFNAVIPLPHLPSLVPTPAEAFRNQLQVIVGSHELLQAGQLANA